jgi:hypothetical protein
VSETRHPAADTGCRRSTLRGDDQILERMYVRLHSVHDCISTPHVDHVQLISSRASRGNTRVSNVIDRKEDSSEALTRSPCTACPWSRHNISLQGNICPPPASPRFSLISHCCHRQPGYSEMLFTVAAKRTVVRVLLVQLLFLVPCRSSLIERV